MSIHRLGVSKFMERGVRSGIVKYYLVPILPDGPYSSPLEYAHSRIFVRHVMNGDIWLSTGRSGSGLCPTRNRFIRIEWRKKAPAVNPSE